MSDIEHLKACVSAMDASLKNLVSEDKAEREDAQMDVGALLTAAKAVVLAS